MRNKTEVVEKFRYIEDLAAVVTQIKKRCEMHRKPSAFPYNWYLFEIYFLERMQKIKKGCTMQHKKRITTNQIGLHKAWTEVMLFIRI